MTDYDKLVKIIQQANPEILLWQLGCRVKDSDGEWTLIAESVERQWHAYRENYGIDYLNLDHCEILGRSIRLADVLLAWKRQGGFGAASLSNQLLMEEAAKKTLFHIYQIWNLKDDNLAHQTDATKEFLIKLLV